MSIIFEAKISKQISEALAKGRVYSQAAGRIGEVVKVREDGMVELQLGKSKGVTYFDDGDIVQLVYKGGKTFIRNKDFVDGV